MKLNKVGLTFSLLFLPMISNAMTLEEFLQQVKAKHRTALSFEASKEAAVLRKDVGDTELSPMLSLTSAYLDDQKTAASVPTYIITRNKTSSYSLALSKQFSTGTKASLSANANQVNINAISSGIPAQQSIGTSGMGISLSQSLWRNFFGSATRTRQQLDEQTSKLEKTGYDLQLKQLFISAEGAFWDFVYIQEELEQRLASLERAKKIENWIRTRVGNGIGDQGDLLGAQSLVASRKLELLVTQDEHTSLKKKISDYLEITDSEKIPQFESKLTSRRDLTKMVERFSEQGKIVRLDSYLSILEAKAKTLGSQQAADAMRPDLQLSGSYSTNQYNSNFNTAVSNIANADTPTSQIALTFSWMLDGDVRKATSESARMDALAATLKKERQMLESNRAWSELNRRNAELTKKIEAVRTLSEFNRKKAQVEKNKLNKGRTVTSNVITSEQDASETELNLTRLMAEQRKLESQARMFVYLGESL